jgi:hypothetical protein
METDQTIASDQINKTRIGEVLYLIVCKRVYFSTDRRPSFQVFLPSKPPDSPEEFRNVKPGAFFCPADCWVPRCVRGGHSEEADKAAPVTEIMETRFDTSFLPMTGSSGNPGTIQQKTLSGLASRTRRVNLPDQEGPLTNLVGTTGWPGWQSRACKVEPGD